MHHAALTWSKEFRLCAPIQIGARTHRLRPHCYSTVRLYGSAASDQTARFIVGAGGKPPTIPAPEPSINVTDECNNTRGFSLSRSSRYLHHLTIHVITFLFAACIMRISAPARRGIGALFTGA